MHKIGEVVVLDGRNFHGTYFRTLCQKKSILHIFSLSKSWRTITGTRRRTLNLQQKLRQVVMFVFDKV